MTDQFVAWIVTAWINARIRPTFIVMAYTKDSAEAHVKRRCREHYKAAAGAYASPLPTLYPTFRKRRTRRTDR
jgi:hypothetical protein